MKIFDDALKISFYNFYPFTISSLQKNNCDCKILFKIKIKENILKEKSFFKKKEFSEEFNLNIFFVKI